LKANGPLDPLERVLKLRTTAIRVPLSGLSSSGALVSASHCWTSQQWHPHFKTRS